MGKKRLGLRPRLAGLTLVAATAAALVVVPLAFGGAISSTTNPAADNGGSGDPVLCLNGGAGANTGSGAVNCNIYTDKSYVWLSGLPDSASLDPGTYFFAVLDPGGQRNPNDGTAGNLSDDTDAWTNRTFTLDAGGNLTTVGNHDVAGNRIRVGVSPALESGGPDWFADTDNNGGVYILAVCAVPDPATDSPGVDPKDCKYDAFKISQTDTTPPASDLDVSKTVDPARVHDYDWAVAKTQTTSSAPINASGSNASVAYRVTATWSDNGDTYSVAGDITVTNPNSYSVTGVAATDDILSDANDTCTVSDGSDGTNSYAAAGAELPDAAQVVYPYACTYSGTPSLASETNRATVTWDASNALPSTSATYDATVTWPTSPTSYTHATTTVTDAFNNQAAQTLGVANVNGTWTTDSGNHLTSFSEGYDVTNHRFTLTYSRSVTVVANACTTYNNTATVSTDNITTNNSANASVTVCGRITGGLTIGFWSNNNGRAVLCAHDPGWRYLLNGGNPSSTSTYFLRSGNGNFYYVSTSGTCNSADSNFASWLLNATATNMSYMLSAQLAGTILNVNFNGMGGALCIAGIDGNPITISSLIANAIAFLRLNPNTTASGTPRNTATLYKNIFDTLNNGKGFAVSGCV
jgi:hypothetical protein